MVLDAITILIEVVLKHIFELNILLLKFKLTSYIYNHITHFFALL